MRAYDLQDERAIQVGRLVDDWTKSGLLSAEQRDTIAPDLRVELRRTNLFLRLTLFNFSMLIIQSALGLVAVTIDIRSEAAIGAVATTAAIACYLLAVFLVDRYRLYRFGVEEAAAVAAVGFMGVGGAFGWSGIFPGSGDWAEVAGLFAGAAAAVVVFLRFGYLYAALAAMVCVAWLPFQIGDSEPVQRIVAASLLAGVAAGAWRQRDEHGDDYPGDTYRFIEAAAWLGIYAVLNLQVSTWFTSLNSSSWFYWVTYAGIWIVPLVGLSIAIRDRQRPLLDVSLLMVLATLMSNKAYLGVERYAWDPVVFGLLLMGTAIGVRRWLASGANGDRHGFTPSRVLISDKSKVGVIGFASVAHPGAPAAQVESAPAEPIGGREAFNQHAAESPLAGQGSLDLDPGQEPDGPPRRALNEPEPAGSAPGGRGDRHVGSSRAHRLDERRERAAYDLAPVLGVERLGERGRAFEVAEEHRDLPALALGRAPRQREGTVGAELRIRGDGERAPRAVHRALGLPSDARGKPSRSERPSEPHEEGPPQQRARASPGRAPRAGPRPDRRSLVRPPPGAPGVLAPPDLEPRARQDVQPGSVIARRDEERGLRRSPDSRPRAPGVARDAEQPQPNGVEGGRRDARRGEARRRARPFHPAPGAPAVVGDQQAVRAAAEDARPTVARNDGERHGALR
jgi:hypothetical protein